MDRQDDLTVVSAIAKGEIAAESCSNYFDRLLASKSRLYKCATYLGLIRHPVSAMTIIGIILFFTSNMSLAFRSAENKFSNLGKKPANNDIGNADSYHVSLF